MLSLHALAGVAVAGVVALFNGAGPALASGASGSRAETVVAEQNAGVPAVAREAVRPELEYVYPDQSVWTARIDANGNPENPLLKVATILFARAGLSWHSKSLPAARMFAQLQEHPNQFSMLVKAPSLERCCLLSHQPVARTELRAYRFKDRPQVSADTELAGKSVIVIRGYSYGKILEFLTDGRSRVSVSQAPTHEVAFRMLETGRADYLLEYAGPAREVLTLHPIEGLDFDVLTRLEVFLVLSRTYPNAEAVMARLEAIAATLNVAEILAVLTERSTVP